VETRIRTDHLFGWTVLGRHGPLGRVIDAGDCNRSTDSNHVLLVRGGTTDVLYYHVPLELVSRVMPARRSIRIDADVSDFAAQLRPDGSVDLLHVANG
jgi:hypothetical protein